VTYPDEQVAQLLNDQFIPVRVDIEQAGKLADRYQALWTPNLNLIDGGREKGFYQVIGWLPPLEFAAMLNLARSHFHLGRKQFSEAAPLFRGVFEKFPQSLYAPESVYFRGVSRYLADHSVEALKEDWNLLQRRYPDSQWAMKSNLF
jgi:hypothetical protein